MIKLFVPFIPPETGDEVKKVIDSGMINRGAKSDELEARLRDIFKFKYVHLVNSCTSALRLSLAIAQIGKGDEVITTPWSMIATSTSILEQGAKPVYVDIEYDTLNIDADKIEDAITKATKAIVMVHYAGYPCDIDRIRKIGADHNLVVIEDAAQALGAMYKKKWIGESGIFNCFSFQAIKTITMGDGGCISTIAKDVYDEAVRRSWFGIDKSKRVLTAYGAFPSDITELGYKYNVTDIDATMGLVGMKHLPWVLNRRATIARIYDSELDNLKKVDLLEYEKDRLSSYWMYPIHVEDRTSFAKFMTKAGIEVSKHNERNDKYTITGGIQDLINTRRVDKDIIHIPVHTGLSEKDVYFIVKKIKEWNKQ